MMSDIRDYYEQIRQEERDALQERINHVLLLNSSYAQIIEARENVVENCAKALKKGASAAVVLQESNRKLKELKEQERLLLASLKLPEDYLCLQVRCPLCADTGFVGETKKKPCICLEKKARESLYASSQISENETFETFSSAVYPTAEQREQMQRARQVAETFSNEFPHTNMQNLVLLGTAGLGKTFLLNCIAKRVLERGYAIRKLTAYSLQEQVLSGIRSNTNGAAEFLNVPLLLIDDLGSEPMINNVTQAYMFSILNERMNARLHTIVATNLTLGTLQSLYGERIFSRLINADDSRVLRLQGQNLRLLQKPKGDK
ncbi:ATP-binding protein [Eubacteriales bacterium OttesenSCG-928-K08]|nr:ATP-binding protein [Eubacteriales bacterium OttesenSCG-928-K08]